MAPWILRPFKTPHFRIFERPLGLTELGFYWDSKFAGTADTLERAIVEILDQDPSSLSARKKDNLFSIENVTRTWLALKQQFPLLASALTERKLGGDGPEVSFLVEERRLYDCTPEEITFSSVASLGEAQEFVDNVINGKRLLSDTQVSRIFILTRDDDKNLVHLLIHVAHCITDGIANATLLRRFLDILSSRLPLVSQQWNLEERLSLASASEDLISNRKLGKAKQRWRRAIAHTLASIRTSNITGGHTLPRKLTSETLHTPARSGHIFTSISSTQSSLAIQTCRHNKITFGNVLPVLAQVALTRVLLRRFLRGDIGHKEWEYRKREPMTTGGPLSLRPLLDPRWIARGGSDNVSLAIGFFHHTLPFMPLGDAADIRPGDALPNFGELLTPGRFWLRCQGVKRQATRLFGHPLFMEMMAARAPARIERLKEVAMSYMGKTDAYQDGAEQHAVSAIDQGRIFGPVMSHGGSSFGNVDHIIPREYPLLRTRGEPARLFLQSSGVKLHCRPTELYLGASTARQQLHLSVFWDQNVFEDDVVGEWLGEVNEAVEFYLARDGKELGWTEKARL